MRLTYTLMMTDGPAVGVLDVADRQEAATALDTALRNILGARYTSVHDRALAPLLAQLRTAELPFVYRVPAVSVTLED